MSQATQSDIAIIGMSCRVAGANSPSEFWDLLASSRDVQSKITRFNSEGFYHQDGGPRKGLTNVNRAYMLDDGVIDKFDNMFFHIPPQEAIAMDPQQRMLMEVAYEAIESAGIPLDAFTGSDTAVFAGMEGCEYHSIAGRDLDATPRYLATGTPLCMAANRISYFFNLSGSSMSVDTACSSAMVALHQAVRALQHGDSKMAIVCGAKLILSPDMFMPSSELGFLGPSGRCHTFDAAADGYGRGEGVIALLIKPLKEAIANRDPIRAVIKGTRLNQDGRTQGITLPSADAQRRNMQALYEELGIPPADIQYLEAHGTGTAAGDPLEFSAISSVYGQSRGAVEPLVVGSVKSNIGHLEATSALASILKVALCLEKGRIPPQMNFKVPNPKIIFRSVKIPTQMTSWPATNRDIRRAAVNTFGAGGTNGHAVLEAYSGEPLEISTLEKRPYLFKISAADDKSLSETSLSFAKYVETSKPQLRDLAHTMLASRSTLKKSIFFTAGSHDEVITALRRDDHDIYVKPSEVQRDLIFVFTGQGAQWVQMGMSLVDQCPLFKFTLHECDHILSELPDPPTWTTIEELSKAKETSNINRAEFSQPLCTALQLGLVTVLKSWGVTPNAVIGHSSGEIGAAYAAGILSLRDAMVVSYYRGLVLSCTSDQKGEGSMCAVGLNEDEVNSMIQRFAGRVQIAAVNSPSSCTISGDVDAIREIVEQLLKEKRFCRELKVDQAYHSHHMLPLAVGYEDKLAQATVTPLNQAAKCDMYSSVHGRRIDTSECTSSYWKQNMTSTVNFHAAFTECINARPKVAVIVEIGPHPALKGPVQESLRALSKSNIVYLPTCIRSQQDYENLLSSAGAIIGNGLPIHISNINAHTTVTGLQCRYRFGNFLTDAPSYQWNHSQRFWAESRVSRNVRFRKFPRHQLLGSRYVDDIPSRPCWRNRLMLKEIPWLQELKFQGLTEMPPAAYLLLALEAARQLSDTRNCNSDSFGLSKVILERQLPLSVFSDAESAVEVQLNARETDVPNTSVFEIIFETSAEDESWARHCSGNLDIQTIFEPSIPRFPDLSQDQALMNQAEILEPNISESLSNLRLSPEGLKGEFKSKKRDFDDLAADPLVLNSILRLAPMSVMSQRPLAEWRLSSLASLTISNWPQQSSSDNFATRVKPPESGFVESDNEIRQSGKLISLQGIRYRATKVLFQKPPLDSLFFKPVVLPDITRLAPFESMSISRCAQLLGHKWPSCDVKVDSTTEPFTVSILRAFGAGNHGARPFFRSIKCMSVPPDFVSDRVHLLDDSDMSGKYHMIFSNDKCPVTQLSDHLYPGGLLCVPKSDMQGLRSTQSTPLELICDIAGLGQHPWVLLRHSMTSSPAFANRRIVVFAERYDLRSLNGFERTESVPLEPDSLARFCQQDSFPKFDAIIIDCPEKPVVITWTGAELIPWFHILLKYAHSTLWVTHDRHTNPFSNVAGSLLRTLQAEQPSLKVSWLVTTKSADKNRGMSGTQIEQAYIKMIEGENELARTAGDFGEEILRYLPDDCLSAYTGLSLPQELQSPLGEADYSLDFAAPGEPVILSYKAASTQPASSDAIEVLLEASVVDSLDLHKFNGEPNNIVSGPRAGVFFAGRVHSSQDPDLPPGTRVVGWHADHDHRNKVSSRPDDLCRYPSSMPPSQAASRYAAIAVASCIVDGVARARCDETFVLDVQVPLVNAIEKICKRLGASMLDISSGLRADFVVTFRRAEGLLVNDRPIDLTSYMCSDFGRVTVQRDWQELRELALEVDEYNISDYKKAFTNAKQPYSTVLRYRNASNILQHVPIYKKSASMFTSDARYVVVGGLGGLGRFICSWMIENGARHITIVSRSGAGTQESREAISAMQSSGASIQCIKADACDRIAISEILCGLRNERRIGGVINLAMVLGDAPLSIMTPEEWDRVLHVKIQSSWILHEETLQDQLDFFILFSSIASVLGNRNQGNYNVANAALNSLAEYRQSLGLPGISVALGAMTDMGVLYNLSNPQMLQILSRSGLTHLTKYHLSKIMEAAVLESSRRDRSLIVTGLNMFEREADGSLSGRTEPVMWTDWPEFGHLQQYKLRTFGSESDLNKAPLKDQVVAMRHKGGPEQVKDIIRNAFLTFLSQLLGFAVDAFDTSQSLNMHGIDSLSGVSCQYWFHRELEVDVSAGEALGGDSIENIIERVSQELMQTHKGILSL